MNIDLRSVSLDLEEQITRIKMQFGINTNSKAVEHATVNYLQKLKEIEDLKKQLADAKHKLSHYERRLDNLKDLFSWIMQE